MKLTVNAEATEISDSPVTVAALLKHKSVQMPDMVSVQVNGAFVDRREFETRTLAENDEVDFLYFMGGGQL